MKDLVRAKEGERGNPLVGISLLRLTFRLTELYGYTLRLLDVGTALHMYFTPTLHFILWLYSASY